MKEVIEYLTRSGYHVNETKLTEIKTRYRVTHGWELIAERMSRKQLYWFYLGVKAEKGD